MASSRTPPPADPLAAIRARVADTLARAALAPGQRLLLGFSGGLDSTVLLHALAPLRGRFAFVLHAHHVHHGLSPHADAWASHCAAACAVLGVPMRVSRVRVAPEPGEGIEAAARRARHQAWAADAADWWVSAHHRDDQAETVLFRLCRGAGVHGAAAMASVEPAAGGPGRLRPLLSIPRRALAEAAAGAGLRWVEDESNRDTRFTRNFLRHRVLPLLGERFGAVGATLARAAGHFAEAGQLLDDLARLDAAACGRRPMGAAALRALGPARQANLLRWQLRGMGLQMPDEARLHEALRQLASAGPAHPLCLDMGPAWLHVYRDQAWLTPPLPRLPVAPVDWSAAAPLAWGEGHVEAVPAVGEGVGRAWLDGGGGQVCTRWPGCRLRLPGRPAKGVRQLAQEAGIAPVLRDRLPILRIGGQAAWMAGVGVDAAFACAPGAPGLVLRWVRPVAYSESGETSP
jgi:tRNA(Ile)-lysidine synthase